MPPAERMRTDKEKQQPIFRQPPGREAAVFCFSEKSGRKPTDMVSGKHKILSNIHKTGRAAAQTALFRRNTRKQRNTQINSHKFVGKTENQKVS